MTPQEKHQLYLRYKYKRDEIYTPLLKEFILANKEHLQTCGYPWAPFIPYAFPSYGVEGKKVFYIGIDTYYWNTTPEDLINGLILDNFEYLLLKNDSIVTSLRILLESEYSKGSFWQFVCKLQLYIQTGQLYSTDDLRKLSLKEVSYVDSIGYGNLNSLELPKTLCKEGSWDSIDDELYWEIKTNADSIFNPLKNILDVYNPDYVVILSAEIDEDKFFKGIKYTRLNKYDDDSFRSLYKVDGYNTKVIRTCHPRGFGGKSTNDSEMVPYIYESFLLFDK